MNPTTRSRTRSRVVTVLAAALVASAAGCADGGAQQSGSTSTSAGAIAGDAAALQVSLVVGDDHVASATLAPTRAARELAAALPLTVEMEDRFGQAKAGVLPGELRYTDIGRVLDPAAGQIYYWPTDGTIAVITADVGPSIPAPGLVSLGTIDTGLDALVSAGNRFEMTIESAR